MVFFGVDQAEDFASVDELVFEQFADELVVFFPACGQLAEREVVFFETQAAGYVVAARRSLRGGEYHVSGFLWDETGKG